MKGLYTSCRDCRCWLAVPSSHISPLIIKSDVLASSADASRLDRDEVMKLPVSTCLSCYQSSENQYAVSTTSRTTFAVKIQSTADTSSHYSIGVKKLCVYRFLLGGFTCRARLFLLRPKRTDCLCCLLTRTP